VSTTLTSRIDIQSPSALTNADAFSGLLEALAEQQALARAGGGKRHSGEDAARAVLRMAELKKQLRTKN